MAATDEMVALALATRPEIVTLVPEKRQDRTTEGGLDLQAGRAVLAPAIERLTGAGIAVSLFIDPNLSNVRLARELGAPRVELHTGDYAHARGAAADNELDRLASATEEAIAQKLHVAAGHGLDYQNVVRVAQLPGVDELDIGHSIIGRAVFVGLERAVRDLLELVTRPA
jgi:pyridoxine 5-phosphate synthase